jgi:glycerophosphoryl diester phosphodiesterase
MDVRSADAASTDTRSRNRTLTRIAHRGGGVLAAANSLAGIEASISHGIEMVEVDVRRTLDDQLVLSHDPQLDDAEALIRGSTLAELRAAHADVATLPEALHVARGRTRLNLDLKEEDTLDLVLADVRAADALGGCIVSCLHASCLARLAEAEPAVPRFLSYPPDYGNASRKPWLTPAVNAVVAMMRMSMAFRMRRMLRPLPGTGITLYSPLITPKIVELAHRLGIEIYTWTVDDIEAMRRLASFGVDGITSNRPDLLAAL